MRKSALKIGMIPQKSEWLSSLGPSCDKTLEHGHQEAELAVTKYTQGKT